MPPLSNSPLFVYYEGTVWSVYDFPYKCRLTGFVCWGGWVVGKWEEGREKHLRSICGKLVFSQPNRGNIKLRPSRRPFSPHPIRRQSPFRSKKRPWHRTRFLSTKPKQRGLGVGLGWGCFLVIKVPGGGWVEIVSG